MADLILTRSYIPIPAPTRKAYLKPKLVQGVGRSDFPTNIRVNGKKLASYGCWERMLARCYCSITQEINPTYRQCSVTEEWLSFTVFERWFTEHYFEGAALDKDLLVPGNLTYGPDTCVFVSQALNNLLVDRAALRGSYPLGVSLNGKKYSANIRTDGRQYHLGTFATPQLAHKAWQLAKAAIIEAFPTNDPRIRAALDLRAFQLRDDHLHGRITLKL